MTSHETGNILLENPHLNSVDAKLLGSDVYIEEYTFFQKVLSK